MLRVIIVIIFVYFVIVFYLSRLVVPHLRFGPDPLPATIPPDLNKAIADLKSRARSKEEFLRLSYDYLGRRYRSERFNTFLKLAYLFDDADTIWRRPGYTPCTQSNHLMRICLVRSGYFTEQEIVKRHVFVNFVPHQYLKVKIDNQWIDVDVGEYQRGLPLGKHLGWFG